MKNIDELRAHNQTAAIRNLILGIVTSVTLPSAKELMQRIMNSMDKVHKQHTRYFSELGEVAEDLTVAYQSGSASLKYYRILKSVKSIQINNLFY